MYITGTSKKIISIAVLSNIIFEPHFEHLIKAQFSSLHIVIYPIPYGEHLTKEYKKQLAGSDIVIVWLNYESLFSDWLNLIYSQQTTEQEVTDEVTNLCRKLHTDISSLLSVRILWFSFEDYYLPLTYITGYTYVGNELIDRINTRIYDALRDKVSFIDLKRLIAEVGIDNTYDPKGKYRWYAPYSKALIEAAVKEIYKQYLIGKGITKKCLVLDCDNVLWGGILSEDGIENIKLGGSGFGHAYQDFQRFVLSLYFHGVILAVCSKNDLSDVMTMFHDHNEMILKEEHIACFKVNWKNKPDNIKQISEILNIGLDSMVFVDDTPAEIEAVKTILPEVTTVLYERDTVCEQLSCFNLKSDVNKIDIKKRNETYRTNQSREALKSQYHSYSDYINALEMKIDIHEATPIEFSRISELTQRANKCTNGKRYTVAEIKERVNTDNVTLYSIAVSDRFSDLGLVGAFEVEGDIITLLCLSCRALGRNLEKKMLEFLMITHCINKINYFSTGKNNNFMSLFADFNKLTMIDHTQEE